MGLPWRFISISAGIVTLVGEFAAGEADAPPGKLVIDIVVSSAAPKTQDAARTSPVYPRMPTPKSSRASAHNSSLTAFMGGKVQTPTRTFGGPSLHQFRCQ